MLLVGVLTLMGGRMGLGRGGEYLLGCGEMADTGFEEVVFNGPFHEVVADG